MYRSRKHHEQARLPPDIRPASLGLLFGRQLWAQYAPLPPAALAGHEDFWDAIRGEVPSQARLHQPRERLLQHAGARPCSRRSSRRCARSTTRASYYMRTRRCPDKAAVRDKLAAMAGCAPDELVITRNTTESLDTVINGYDWKPGDEAVMAAQDYGHMLAQFQAHGAALRHRQQGRLRARRSRSPTTRSCRSTPTRSRRRRGC